MSHSALVQGDNGLEVRRFPDRAAAFEAEASREVVPQRRANGKGRDWTTGRLAKELGLSQNTIIRRCIDGTIPYTDQGTLGRARRMIAPETVRLIRVHGLRGLAQLRQANAL